MTFTKFFFFFWTSDATASPASLTIVDVGKYYPII